MFPRITVFLLLILLSCKGIAQVTPVTERLDSLMQAVNRIGVFNGNVLVAQQGKIIFKRSYGYADGSRTKALQTDMLFDIGSISKEFNGVALLLLQEKGLVNLHDPLRNYLRHLPAWADSVPLATLLNYTSGLPLSAAKSDKELETELVNLPSLAAKPGSTYAYSYSNVYLQRQVIEKVTHSNYKTFLGKNFFTPLNMSRSFVDIPVTDSGVARAFDSDFKESIYDQQMSGWVRLPIDDLYTWVNALDAYKVVNRKSIEQLHQSFGDNETSLGDTRLENKALTWHQHHGSNYNYEALITHDLKDQTVIILMTNSQQFKVNAITDAIRAILKGAPYTVPRRSLYLALREKVLADPDKGIAFYRDVKLNRQDKYDLSFEIGDLINTGRYIQRRQQYDVAISVFSLATLLDAKSSDIAFACQLIGECYEKKNMKQFAIQYYQKAVDKDPANKTARSALERLVE